MGFLSKLAFWKKDDLGLDNELGLNDASFGGDFGGSNFGRGNSVGSPDNLGLPPTRMPDMTNYRGVGDFESQQAMNRSVEQQLHSPSVPSFNYSPAQPGLQPSGSGNQEFEIISAKLDAIKANLDAINQRIANIERIAYSEQQNRW